MRKFLTTWLRHARILATSSAIWANQWFWYLILLAVLGACNGSLGGWMFVLAIAKVVVFLYLFCVFFSSFFTALKSEYGVNL